MCILVSTLENITETRQTPEEEPRLATQFQLHVNPSFVAQL
jgi:hypothetical protein